MEPVVLNRERVALDKKTRMPVLFDDYSDEDFYGVQRKYSIVARVEVKFPIEPRYRDRQHYILSDINGAKIEAIATRYEIVKYFNSLLHEKHVYKMHNVWFGLNPGAFNFRHLNGTMELYFTHQTVVEPYTVPVQMPPFPKHIFLNLDDIAELPNRTLVDIMAIVVHLDTIHRTMWGTFRKIVIMDARWSLHTIKVWGDLLNKNALRWALANENYSIIIGTMFRRFRKQDQMGHNADRKPFTDISSNIIRGDQNELLGPMLDAKERKRKRDRERYAAMSVEQKNEKNRKRREARQRNKGHNVIPNVSGGDQNEQLRLYNQTPRRKEGKLEYIRKRRALQASTLNQGSIAMEVPTYTSEVLHSTADVLEPDSSSDNACDWVIPEYTSTPFMPASTQTEDVGSPDMSTEPLKRKHHVRPGERQAILARQNKKFEANIARNVATLTEDTISDVGQMDDSTQPGSTIEINNTVDDDDEGVIFGEDNDENEGYLFADEDTNEDFEIDGTQDQSVVTDVPDPYDKVYSNIPEETHMLKHVPDCGYCTAKKFEYEPPGFCCRGGKVELAPLETPPQLRRLWDSADSDARHFRDNIRFFNGHFSFTSLYCCLDSMTTNMRDSGIYTFRAQGMMYHNIKSFGSECGAEHTWSFTFTMMIPVSSIDTIVGILRGNPYSEHLRSMGHVENLADYHIALNLDQTLNQKTYNTPLTSEVAAVWIEGSERRGQFSKSVMLHGKDRSSHGIRSYHGCYDALSYPLFFPRGELGWHANIPKIRPGVFNPILHGKRLFQQFAVDTYIKIESSRLDFIRKNQDRLRADLYQGLVDSMLDGDVRGEKVGKRTVLSPSFIGGPRDMRRRYMDAMALELKHRLTKQDILGKVRAYVYVVEFQKRDVVMMGVRKRFEDVNWTIDGLSLTTLTLRLFNCHINVEACGSIKAVKYLFKYIYKGHDRASVVMRDASKENGDVDEIQQYRDARWVTPPEALWRIYGFELSQNSPSVMQLQLHLPNMHMVTFHERQMVERVVNRPGADRSMITAYFEANKLYEEARGILYRDFPEWYTWQQGKVWQRRKRNTGGQVGRIVSALPSEGERFYLRLLLNHVTGATSYVDLRTVDGDTLPSFREAAQRRGLLEADNTIDECLNEAALYQMPSALRRLFATILVFCEPNDVAELWQRHLDTMSEDYHRITQSKSHLQQMVLIDIRNMLQSMGKDIKTFPLPAIIDRYDDSQGIDREIYEEKSAYEKILSVVDTSNGGVFFVDGPGGTGKTYLYKALLAVLRSQDKIAVATATSGVAASIMPGGRTAHSRFKIPLTIDDGAICTFTKQSGTSKLLQKASLIIWDEASMAKRQSIEALDNSMRDIMGRPDLPFGGKTIVFGGDFRQVLPVVRKGSRAQIVAASLRSSYLWESMSHLKLVRNMRAKSDPWFAEYLLRVGGGTEEVNNDGDVRLPDEVCVPYTGDDRDLDRLIDDIYPSLNENMSNTSYITSRAILTTRNDWVDMINMRMIDRFQREQMMYHSFDTAVDDPNNYYPSEFLNTLTPNGLPPHVLKLKIGCPVMLLRNIDPANGLCNGTRLVHAGMRVFLPRIPLCPSDDEMFPFHFKRKQFPLYVALSRATTRLNVKVLVIPVTDDKMNKGVEKKSTINGVTYTKNIVYKEVLTP
ncbi:ATP-dependent DNA helicase PIF1 [Zea mays]|uniref:ATP-dependent DNA helicase n=2 Tax=Zea mays TaxID=4577 RepID=A0A3L6EBV8_MAIZE|nr:ATP-dependent DNA helicase PIF1 [Zea mays]